jgi:cytochrome b6-f complex iron-sulfur subunit
MPVPAAFPPTADVLAPWDLFGIGVAAAVAVVALVVVATVARRDRRPSAGSRRRGSADGPGPSGAATSGVSDGASAAAVTRRVVVQRGILGLFVAALSGVAASAIAYVVHAVADRGRRYTVGRPEAIRAHLDATGTPYYDPVGGFYVVPYPSADVAAARSVYPAPVLDGMTEGFVGLDQTCTHLGCRVQWCQSSKWFECPCHGSQYNAVGEQRRGPAPRGLDRYLLTTVDGQLVVDTRQKFLGPPPGTDTTGQEPAGPHCY